MTKTKKIGPPFKLSGVQEQEIVRLHDERVKIAELATKFGCSGGTITRILHRHGALRPRNATKHEQAVIRKLSGKRSQRAIARILNRSLSFVVHWQQVQGFRAHPKMTAELENQIIALYQTGLGQARVGKLTNTNEKVVHAVLQRHGIPFHKTARPRFQLPPEQRVAFRKAVLSKKYFCKDLQKEFGLSKHIARRLSKEILGVPEFERGYTLPPLSSKFPERACAWTAADLVKFLAVLFPDGVPALPDCAVVPRAVSAILETFPFWREATTPELLGLENHLLTALSTLRAESESAMVQ